MSDEHLPEYVPATPEDILALFRYWNCLEWQTEKAADELQPGMTVADWRDASDLTSWRAMAKAFDEVFMLNQPEENWRQVLEPAKQRTLEEVCDFISRNGGKVPRVRAAHLFGSVCKSAGAFLTIKTFLRQAGADVSQLAPSTELNEYACRYPAVFYDTVGRLAPRRLPILKIRSPLQSAGGIFCLLGFLAIILAIIVDNPFVQIAGVLLLALGYLGLWIAPKLVLPSEVSFGNLRTFRDLARVLADEPAREQT